MLDFGLPDWRQPVYYYRKARKLGLLELALVLCLIVTIGQYFVMWAAYLERRLAMVYNILYELLKCIKLYLTKISKRKTKGIKTC